MATQFSFVKRESFFVILILLYLPCTFESAAEVIHFSGTSYMEDLFTAWSDQYHYQNPAYRFSYSVMDSDESLNMLLTNQSPFAVIDYPLNDSVYIEHPDLQTIPIIGGVVVPYFTLLAVGLTLDCDTVAGIFLGNIKYWNDPAIQATNPSAVLSKSIIDVVYRLDDSIATYALSQALSSISSEWRENYGVSKTFPLELRKKSNFFGAYGEQGATTLTRRFSSGITYLTGNGIFAATNLIQYARIINQNGTRTDIRTTYTIPVLEASVNLFDDHFTADIVNLDLPLAFPFMMYSYIVVRKSETESSMCSQLKASLEFILFSLNSTITTTSADIYGYVHLPHSVIKLVQEKIYSIQCDGKTLLDSFVITPVPYIPYEYNYSIPSFNGLTTVTYVPFWNYLGSTISASQASTFHLTTITSLFNYADNANENTNSQNSSSHSLHANMIIFSQLFLIFLVIHLF